MVKFIKGNIQDQNKFVFYEQRRRNDLFISDYFKKHTKLKSIADLITRLYRNKDISCVYTKLFVKIKDVEEIERKFNVEIFMRGNNERNPR